MPFLKDFKDGKFAEGLIRDYLAAKNINAKVAELGKDRQAEGDISIDKYTVEVKFDKMAKETGNFCFEMANSKGPSGIASTLAKMVYYVVPGDAAGDFNIYGIEVEVLRQWLYDPQYIDLIKVVQGGDRRAFTLMIVPMKTVVEYLGKYIDNAQLHIQMS